MENIFSARQLLQLRWDEAPRHRLFLSRRIFMESEPKIWQLAKLWRRDSNFHSNPIRKRSFFDKNHRPKSFGKTPNFPRVINFLVMMRQKKKFRTPGHCSAINFFCPISNMTFGTPFLKTMCHLWILLRRRKRYTRVCIIIYRFISVSDRILSDLEGSQWQDSLSHVPSCRTVRLLSGSTTSRSRAVLQLDLCINRQHGWWVLSYDILSPIISKIIEAEKE